MRRELAWPALVLGVVASQVAQGELTRLVSIPINFDPSQPVSGIIVAGLPAVSIQAGQIRSGVLRVECLQQGEPDAAGLWDWDADAPAYVLAPGGEGWRVHEAPIPAPFERFHFDGVGFVRPQFVIQPLPLDGSAPTFLGSVRVRLVYAPTCVADFDNGSGLGFPDNGVTVDDLLYYLALFDVGDVNADVDDGSATGTQDQGVTVDDLLYFLDHFAGGC